MGVYTIKPGRRVPLPLGLLFCFKDKRLLHQLHPTPLACLSPTKPLAIGQVLPRLHSLKLISCYFFMGISGLTMRRDFSHLIERNFWLCAGRDVSHDEVLDCFQFQPLLMTEFQSPSSSPSWHSPCELSAPFWEWFLKITCCFQASFSPARLMGPMWSALFWGPCSWALLLPRPAWISLVVTLSFPYLEPCA